MDVSSFELMERDPTKAALPDDALDGEIENTTEMAEILQLRICVELQSDGQEPKPDPLAVSVLHCTRLTRRYLRPAPCTRAGCL